MASKEEDDSERLYFASSISELKKVGRKRVRLENGRVIVLFYVKEEIYALDHFCYRKHAFRSCSVDLITASLDCRVP